ncbi:MAG: hypothetical protein AAGC97_11375 [Planctomycetota bacterium]
MQYFFLALMTLSFFTGDCLIRAASADYEPRLLQSVELIYDEPFAEDGPLPNNERWVIRQNTRWSVKDGVLIGEVADEAYQKKMQAEGDGHDGTRPVIFLTPIPSVFAVQMRVRYDETENKGRNRGSLLDLGHHANSFIFGSPQTKLTLQKEKKIFIDGDFFPLNRWNDVTIEFKDGTLLIDVNGRTEIIEHPLIQLRTDREIQQLDFKGQDFGTVQIDWVKLYRGTE